MGAGDLKTPEIDSLILEMEVKTKESADCALQRLQGVPLLPRPCFLSSLARSCISPDFCFPFL